MQLIPRLLSVGVVPILDMEDSARCDFDPAQHIALKAAARVNLITLASALRPDKAQPLFIRINDPRSGHYDADMEAIAAWTALGHQPRLVLPKAESGKQVESCRMQILKTTGQHALILPIIETREGLERIPEIVTRADPEKREVVFGYFDFAFESGLWPFHDPLTPDFWQLIQPIIRKIEDAGGSYIHPPVAIMDRPADVLRVKAMVMSSCRRSPGFCSLDSNQSAAWLQEVEPRPLVFECPEANAPAAAPADRARFIVASFRQARRNKRSFALIDNRFISPHEYLAAERFLKMNGLLE